MKEDPQKNDLEHYIRIHAFSVMLYTKARQRIYHSSELADQKSSIQGRVIYLPNLDHLGNKH